MAKATGVRRKLVELDQETWNAVDLLGRDSMKTFQELSDEAFRDLLQKARAADRLEGGAQAECTIGCRSTSRAG
jgi:hypothetical protein